MNTRFSSLLSCAVLFVLCETALAATPQGWVDWIDSNGTVAGWARDPDVPNNAIQVHIYSGPAGAGGWYLGAVTASYTHGTGIDGNHGFRFTLPEWIRRAPISSIYVYGIDQTGDGNFPAIGNGNPYPTQVDVTPNDDVKDHASGGNAIQLAEPNQSGLQLGANATGSLVGGRPNNTNFASKWLTTGWSYNALPGSLWWYQTGNSPVIVGCAARLAGGISSVVWDNVEFIDSGGHGAAFQYNVHDGNNNELFNPTEAGSNADDNFAWYGQSIINLNALTSAENPADPYTGSHVYQSASSSATQALSTTDAAGFIHTKQRMAYWIPKSTVGTSGYPKPTNTIYTKEYCAFRLSGDPNNPWLPPFNPPSYNANATFYSLYFPYGPPSYPGYATHAVAAPDSLSSRFYEGVEPLSDYTLEKYVGLGAISGGSVIKLSATLTVPSLPVGAATTGGNWDLYVYPDHVRFHTRANSRTLFYNGGGTAGESRQTGASGTTAGSVIVTDPENRYAIGIYTRTTGAYQFYTQDSTGVQIGTTLPSISANHVYSMANYVVVGTLAGVESQIDTLRTASPPR